MNSGTKGRKGAWKGAGWCVWQGGNDADWLILAQTFFPFVESWLNSVLYRKLLTYSIIFIIFSSWFFFSFSPEVTFVSLVENSLEIICIFHVRSEESRLYSTKYILPWLRNWEYVRQCNVSEIVSYLHKQLIQVKSYKISDVNISTSLFSKTKAFVWTSCQSLLRPSQFVKFQNCARRPYVSFCPNLTPILWVTRSLQRNGNLWTELQISIFEQLQEWSH